MGVLTKPVKGEYKEPEKFPYPLEDWVSLTDKVSRMALTNEFPSPLEDLGGSNLNLLKLTKEQ